ncbi:hypothetical protein ABB37_01482 [Leptomonas pyrrhocoris]|uniref:Uncharacterized protein n=1 Tax=Leptomonas pyrrhocoris TaxID=157538 RepID=A0A0N0DZA4_LEPPY|nr:hypothetical protein ABB37_01482 [Leptomonas pyrrhocoris]KPA85065.1 hypothetical protein ABB37_01482 [Leptomonas pyrrhocoris]|eukprot:XP_015663504.1 hypothetical protein ABB37_01482 [Leptomonas pyrrhocoris]
MRSCWGFYALAHRVARSSFSLFHVARTFICLWVRVCAQSRTLRLFRVHGTPPSDITSTKRQMKLFSFQNVLPYPAPFCEFVPCCACPKGGSVSVDLCEVAVFCLFSFVSFV